MENEASLEIISALVEAGADVNEKNSWGETPFILAAKKDNAPKVIAFLIKTGADTNTRDQYGKRAFDHVPKASGVLSWKYRPRKAKVGIPPRSCSVVCVVNLKRIHIQL